MLKKILNWCGNHKQLLCFLFAFAIIVTFDNTAFASTSKFKLPWEDTLQGFVEALTGPTALYISILAAVIGTVMVVMNPGGDYGQIFKIIGFVVVGGGVLTAALSFFQGILGKGALL